MRSASSLSQLAVMAAIVASMLYPSAGAALALLLWLLGVPFLAFVTFGGALHVVVAMLAWWLLAFAAALVYAVLAFPWAQTRGFPTRKR